MLVSNEGEIGGGGGGRALVSSNCRGFRVWDIVSELIILMSFDIFIKYV